MFQILRKMQTFRSLNRYNQKMSLRCVIVKLSKYKTKGQLQKQQVTYEAVFIRLMADLSEETSQARGKCDDLFNDLLSLKRKTKPNSSNNDIPTNEEKAI